MNEGGKCVERTGGECDGGLVLVEVGVGSAGSAKWKMRRRKEENKQAPWIIRSMCSVRKTSNAVDCTDSVPVSKM
jgi:hypothetical protein